MFRLHAFDCRILLRAGQKLWRDRKGGILIIYAIILPGLVGIVGLGIETGIWYTAKRSLQTQADAAARSGAFERMNGHPEYALVSAAAEQEAQRNGFVNAAPNTLAINNPPLVGPNTEDQSAVEVVLGEQQSLLLSSVFLNDMSIQARSVAAVEVTGSACVLALDPSANGAITNSGNPTVEMNGCVLAANSTSSFAIDIGGNPTLTAESLWTAGGIAIDGSVTINLAQPPTEKAWPIADPYEDVDIPPYGPCEHSNTSFSNVTLTIDPGVYCDGIDFGANSTITLNPGTYYVNRGDVKMNASTVVRCSCPFPGDGVTIVLTSDTGPGTIGTVTINGGADVALRAPTDESYAFPGILFYQDRDAPPGPIVKFNGGSQMLLTGAIYIPNQTIEWAGGNSTAGSTCTQIIGNAVKFVGNSEIINTGCDEAGIQPLEIVGVRIVE